MKLRYVIRSLWEEFKLKLRVLQAAGAAFILGGDITPTGRLFAAVIHKDGSREELGLICTKVVTDAGVAYIVDSFQNLVELENMRYHASGTGVTAEAASQTALVTEVATRQSGTLTEGASANIFRTVGTITYAGAFAITEHGIFSAASAGTLLDRSVFAAINVVASDAIQFTYELTMPSGS